MGGAHIQRQSVPWWGWYSVSPSLPMYYVSQDSMHEKHIQRLEEIKAHTESRHAETRERHEALEKMM